MKKYFIILILHPRFCEVLRVMWCTDTLQIAVFVCRYQCDRREGNISRYIKQHKFALKLFWSDVNFERSENILLG